jgi:putative glutamine amidotransferase
MKKIAITQRLISTQNYFEIREALDIKWGLLFKELKFLPIILPIEFNYKKIFENIKIEGIILTGGNDLNVISKNTLSLKRDNFEKAIIKYGIKKNIPIYGMCRGMELITEFFGGSLKKVKGQVGVRQKLNINNNSKYFSELIKIKSVNSFHNYAVDNLPKDLIISASNKSGIVKAIEHKKYKILSQMWHTERERNFDKYQVNLIKKFFN